MLEDLFIVLNGGTFLPIRYHDFAARLLQSNGKAMIAAYTNEEKIAPNNLAISPDGLVTCYNKTSPLNLTHVDAGVYGFKKEILSEIPSEQPSSLEDLILPSLVREKNLASYPVSKRYYDIGTEERLWAASIFFLKNF